MWFGGGEKMGLFWGSYRGSFRGKWLAGMTFRLKEASKGLGPLDACHRVNRQRETPILIHSSKVERGRGRNKTRSSVLE